MHIAQNGSPKSTIYRMLIVNIIIPFLLYKLLESHMSSVTALTIAAIVPLLETIYGFMKTRKLDIFSSFIFLSLILGILATLVSGDERFILLKESYATGIMGLALIVSLIFQKPLFYYFAKRFMNDPTLENRYQTNKAMRGTFVTLTAVWGIVLLLEVCLKICLVFILPTDRYLLIAPIVTIVIIGVAVYWSVSYVKSLKRKALKNPVRS